VHALPKRLRSVHLNLFKAKSTDEARQLSASLRWLEGHIGTDGLYIIEVPLQPRENAPTRALGGGWWNREEPPTERIVNVGTGEANIVAAQPDAIGSIGTAVSGLLKPDTSP
jgi:hypothetical protein